MHAESPRIVVPNEYPDVVYVAFMEQVHSSATYSDRGTCIDVLSAARQKQISPAFNHCQFVFDWTVDEKRVTFSTSTRTPSRYVSVAYKNSKWRALRLEWAQQDKRRSIFMWTQRNLNVPFNRFGYYWNFLPPVTCFPCCAYDADGESYFCAEQVVACLRDVEAPIISLARPYVCTPDDVYYMLRMAGCPETFIRIPPHIFEPKPVTLGDAVVLTISEDGDDGDVNAEYHFQTTYVSRLFARVVNFVCGWTVCCYCCCECCRCTAPEHQQVEDRILLRDCHSENRYDL
jgi:hypothetical protein